MQSVKGNFLSVLQHTEKAQEFLKANDLKNALWHIQRTLAEVEDALVTLLENDKEKANDSNGS
jgi:hypothetical protein